MSIDTVVTTTASSGRPKVTYQTICRNCGQTYANHQPPSVFIDKDLWEVIQAEREGKPRPKPFCIKPGRSSLTVVRTGTRFEPRNEESI